MSQNTIRAIIQDQTGFLWLGTQDGLNRYDGYEFKVFRHINGNPHSISNNFITSLDIDSRGLLWIGTQSNSISCFNAGSGQFINAYPDPVKNSRLYSDQLLIVKACRGNSSGIWVGTLSSGLFRFDFNTRKFTRIASFISGGYPSSVNAVCEDPLGGLWVGTDRGLFFRMPGAKKFSPVHFDFKNRASPGNLSVLSLLCDRDNILWAGTSQGLWFTDIPTSEQLKTGMRPVQAPEAFCKFPVYSMAEDSRQRLWLAQRKGGIWVLDKQNHNMRQFTHSRNDSFSLSTDALLSVFVDRSDIVWAGTYTEGLDKFDPRSLYFNHHYHVHDNENSLGSNLVKCIYEDLTGQILIGTFNSGLEVFDPKSGVFRLFSSGRHTEQILRKSRIISILEDHRNRLWLGTSRSGLLVLNKQKNASVKRYSFNPQKSGSIGRSPIKAIFQDRFKTIWIGTQSGIFRFRPEKQDFIHYQLTPDYAEHKNATMIRCICEDLEGKIWAGGQNGLFRYNRSDDSFVSYSLKLPQKNGLIDVQCILEPLSQPGTLWLGCYGKGLLKVCKQKGAILPFKFQKKFPSDVVYGILEEKNGSIWASTNSGIARINPEGSIITTYDVHDGLQGNEFNPAYLKSSDGTMYFGGQHGLNRFSPEAIVPDRFSPGVVITGLHIINPGSPVITVEKNLNNQTVNLTHRQKIISVSFTGIHFRSPKKQNYAFMMAGLDNRWRTVPEQCRFVTYTNLTPGSYTFRVKAANRDRIWSENSAEMYISISPPFWQTLWFKLIFLILSVLLLFLSVHFLLIRQKRKNLRLIETGKKIVETADSIHMQVGMELHDNLSHDLLDIAIKAKVLSGSLKEPEASQAIQLNRLTCKALSKTRNIARGVLPELPVESGFLTSLDSLARTAENQFQISCNVCIEKNSHLPLAVFESKIINNLLCVIREAVKNAARHSGTDKIQINVHQTRKNLSLIIRDFGTGILPEKMKSRGIGLKLMEYRARIINASLKISSVTGSGTSVILNLPIAISKHNSCPGNKEKTNCEKNAHNRVDS